MGAPPELPNPSEDDLRLIEANVHHPQIVSDESDNEQNDYEGYEPLAIDDEQENIEVEQQQNSIEVNSSLPVIERAEFELERQVWNAPRPQETNIELDATRTAQILNAMASFTLPNLVLPEWAVGVPEERWKEVLLERIRQSKEEQQDISETT